MMAFCLIRYTITTLLLSAIAGGTVSCPNGFVVHGNTCYHFSTDTETWADAMIMCRLKGATLAEINSVAENAYLLSTTKQIAANTAYWVGGTDSSEEGVWVWASTNTPIVSTLTSWTPGEPNNTGGDEDCLELYGGLWNDDACRKAFRYICEVISGIDSEIVG